MSIEGHDRRLLRVAKKGWAHDNSLVRMVFAIHREKSAALTLVKFAQVLAGTDQRPETPKPVREEPRLPPDHPFAAPSPPSRPAWGPNNRPGVHDVLTWEEAMRLPWIEGEDSVLR